MLAPVSGKPRQWLNYWFMKSDIPCTVLQLCCLPSAESIFTFLALNLSFDRMCLQPRESFGALPNMCRVPSACLHQDVDVLRKPLPTPISGSSVAMAVALIGGFRWTASIVPFRLDNDIRPAAAMPAATASGGARLCPWEAKSH